MKRIPLLIAIALLALVAAPLHAADDQTFDDWYVILMDDQPMGWMHAVRQRKGDHLVSTNQVHLSIKRGQAAMTMEMSDEFVETLDAKAVSMGSTQALGAITITMRATFKTDGVEVTTEQGGQTTTRADPLPQGQWYTPAAFERYADEQIAKGETAFGGRVITPLLGLAPVRIDAKKLGQENIEVLGKTVPAQLWETTTTPPGAGATERIYVDEKYRLLKSTMDVMGMKLTVLAADKELAQKQVNPPDLLAKTLIKPDKPIKDARKLRSAVYELTFDQAGAQARAESAKPRIPSDNQTAQAALLPRGGYQRVVWADDHTARVVVDLDSPVNPGTDLPTDASRKSSTLLNSDDPEVRKLADQAVAELPKDATPAQQAEAMRRFVHGYVTAKDLSVGFASAGQVARTRQGDCTEHAVLLAAMLRAGGIASRTVSGVIYIDRFMGQDHVFGYHLWTQAWLGDDDAKKGGRWVDLDATLADQPFDAAHIALSTGDLAGDAINDIMRLAPITGTLRIGVIEP
ncbi:MAG: transglutaminase-like domain-containing protein [Phycisphaeraceae bacterium]